MTRAAWVLTVLLSGCAGDPPAPDGHEEPTAQTTPCVVPVKEQIYCTMQYDPVCGCNGVTFSNACTARAAGVQRARPGRCEDTEPPEG